MKWVLREILRSAHGRTPLSRPPESSLNVWPCVSGW